MLRLALLTLALIGLYWGIEGLGGDLKLPGPVPLDVLLLIGLVVALPARRWLAGPVAALLTAGLVLLAMQQAVWVVLGRSLNPVLDAALLGPLEQLLRTNLGALPAWALLLAVPLMLAGLAWLLARQLRRLAAVTGRRALARLALLVGLALGLGGWQLRLGPDAERPAYELPLATTFLEQSRRALATLDRRRRFVARITERVPPVASLPGLSGRDVLLVFIESYGMSLYDEPASARRLEDVLQKVAPRLAEAGIQAASGRLRSPIRGGQSWLAHASVLSGLRIDDNLDYRLLMANYPGTLVQDLAAGGHRTLAVLPGITRAWPAGRTYGFDRLEDARSIPYAGPALNWVTMPDQFTLADFQRRLRAPEKRPLFAHVALVSSHAPWTPILPVLPWQEIDDGQRFAAWADAGEAPQALWQDLDRVRDHYARAVAYSLTVVLQWAEHYLGDEALLMMMGDHPAAPLITGEGTSPDVPVHLLSRDAALLAPFAEAGFAPGLMPPKEGPVPDMADWRGLLHRYFGGLQMRCEATTASCPGWPAADGGADPAAR